MPTVSSSQISSISAAKDIDPDSIDLDGAITDSIEEIDGDSQELSLQEIYDKICIEDDIYIVIDAIEEPRVRKGLSGIKAKRNAKLKDNNLPIDDNTLEFVKHEDTELAKLGRVRLQIYLKHRATIRVHELKVADGAL